ncbi:hypothetical protein [Neomoorella thermoacetica]|uniref:hypothetical protein n=1 Tax=Neomoorella thermoacetica TaxID=1525 RepID=UPI0030D475AA
MLRTVRATPVALKKPPGLSRRRFTIIILTNIYGVLKDIACKIDRSGRHDRL